MAKALKISTAEFRVESDSTFKDFIRIWVETVLTTAEGIYCVFKKGQEPDTIKLFKEHKDVYR
jgi:hypothetical protein